ncbi:hypothetical protein [Vibrio sp. CyArs1]|uniref:hypothetical protein n=1 Tax=Vibrio sp. CyArs1 TaxID=2682577 RepID=UPI001F0572D6|nr:hypothetical protein [Vibrio sp. CyArs1]
MRTLEEVKELLVNNNLPDELATPIFLSIVDSTLSITLDKEHDQELFIQSNELLHDLENKERPSDGWFAHYLVRLYTFFYSPLGKE